MNFFSWDLLDNHSNGSKFLSIKSQYFSWNLVKGFRAKIDAIRARLILQIYTVLKIDNFHPISLKEIEDSNSAKSESSSFESNSGL